MFHRKVTSAASISHFEQDESNKFHNNSCQRWMIRQWIRKPLCIKQFSSFLAGAGFAVAVALGAQQYMIVDPFGNTLHEKSLGENRIPARPILIPIFSTEHVGTRKPHLQLERFTEEDVFDANASEYQNDTSRRYEDKRVRESKDKQGYENKRANMIEVGHSPLFDPGELDLGPIHTIPKHEPFERQIHHEFIEGYVYREDRRERPSFKSWSDYFAFDDDIQKHPYCRRPDFYYHHHPTCNAMHELGNFGAENDGVFVGHGAFREAWTYDLTGGFEDLGEVIVKQLRYDHDFVDDFLEDIRKDAMVMDLMKSSPRIVDIYSHCGTTVLVESLKYQIEPIIIPKHSARRYDNLPSRNDLSYSHILEWSLGMAEALADLHGFKGGIISHCDIQPAQFFLTWGTHEMKLSDFNRAEVLLWDPGYEGYCRFDNGRGHGGVSVLVSM